MPLESLALILFLLPLAWSPGPGNVFFATLGARAGLAASWPASLGYHLATWVVTLALGFGFGHLAGVAGQAAQGMALAGGAYVLWMAWRLWGAGMVAEGARASRAGVQDGAVLLLLNPKAYAIIAAMFAQFLADDRSIERVLWVTTLFTLNNLVAFTVWTWAGARLLGLWQNRISAALLNRGSALLLAGVALWMMLR
ncbi:LysE family translocator [Natronohydrobacter thiooxidans]|uniref:LysE family translocator n=1 Tax=Natronohydrobacter thiooxidans TaxID=87172 RepID=UPI0008FF78E0|nr:LysE family transporter [Natronohydrobacter thiooxidans]